MADPFTFTKRRGVWMHSIGCDWEMRERGKDCSCGLVKAWEAEQAHIRAIWLDGPDSEAARAARGEGSGLAMRVTAKEADIIRVCLEHPGLDHARKRWGIEGLGARFAKHFWRLR